MIRRIPRLVDSGEFFKFQLKFENYTFGFLHFVGHPGVARDTHLKQQRQVMPVSSFFCVNAPEM